MSKIRIGYARCSTEKQDLAAQRAALLDLDVAEDRKLSGLGPFRSNSEEMSRDEIKTAIKRSSIVSLDNGREIRSATK